MGRYLHNNLHFKEWGFFDGNEVDQQNLHGRWTLHAFGSSQGKGPTVPLRFSSVSSLALRKLPILLNHCDGTFLGGEWGQT